MSSDILKSAIRTEVLNSTGYDGSKVLMANQSRGTPALPYATIYFINTNFLHQSSSYWVETTPDNFDRVVDQVQETTVRFQVFGDSSSTTSAFDEILSLYSHFLKASTIERLDENGIKVINTIAQPQDVSQAVSGTDYEFMAFFDLLFRQKLVVSESLEPVESIEYTGTIDESDIITGTVSI